MATHSNVLAWRIPGTGEPGGLLSMGSHRVGHDWSDLAAAAAAAESVKKQSVWGVYVCGGGTFIYTWIYHICGYVCAFINDVYVLYICVYVHVSIHWQSFSSWPSCGQVPLNSLLIMALHCPVLARIFLSLARIPFPWHFLVVIIHLLTCNLPPGCSVVV